MKLKNIVRAKLAQFATSLALALNIFQPFFLAANVSALTRPSSALAEELSLPQEDPAQEEPTSSVSPTPAPIAASAETSPTPTPTPPDTPSPSVEPESSVLPSPEPTPTITASPSPEPENVPETTLTTNIEIESVNTLIEPDLSESNVSDESAKVVPSVTTDQADYPPTGTVVITGSDLTPHTTYLLRVSSTDPPASTFEINVTTDSAGAFVYSYQLDGIYRPNYTIEITLGGTLVATTTFTDSVVVTPATGGTNIPSDKAVNGTSPAYTTLGDIIIAEASNTDFSASQTSSTLILSAPTNWNFNPGVGTVSFQAGRDLGPVTISVSSTTITITFTTDSNANKSDTITISGVQVQAIDESLIPSSGNIIRSSGNPGTGTITGITNDVTNFGSLSQAISTSITWPTTWDPYLVNGLPIYDDEKIGGHDDPSSGGTSVSPESIDIASGAVFSGSNPGTEPSVLLRTDADPNYIFYRIRLADDPFSTGGGSRHWDILLDIDNDGYKEYVIDMDHNGDVFGVYYNNDNSNEYDPTLDDVWTVSSPVSAGYVRSVPEDYGTASPSDDQYYIDFAVPTSVFGSDLASVLAAEAVFYSTSASNTDPLQKDYMGFSGFIFGIEKETSLDGTTWSESETATAGASVYFRITLTNTGNANMTGVSLEDSLPSGFSYITGSTTGETTSDPTISGQVLTWSGPFTVNAGDSIEIIFEVATPSITEETTYTNTIEAYKDTTTLLGSDTSDVVLEPATGTLRVIKVVVNDNGGDASASAFSFQVDGGIVIPFEEDGQNDLTLTVGEYSVTEPATLGYSTSYDNCTSVEVTLGGTTTCTITNDDIAPSLTLVKEVINDHGGSATSSAWTLTATGPTTISGAGPTVLSDSTFVAGSYSLSESGGPSGYTASSWVCVGASQTGTNTVALAVGDSATCTITNDDVPGTLTVNKITNPVEDDTTDFTITATGSGSVQGSSTQSITGGSSVIYTVDAGTYSVTEDFLAGWSETANDCTNIWVGNGEEESCTIENTKLGSISGFKWEDQDGDGFWDAEEPALVNWLITLLEDDLTSASQYTASDGSYSFEDLLPGDYSLIEELLLGWTQTASPSGIVLGAGDVSEDNNFGNFQNITISGLKFNDLDGDGVKGPGEDGLEGWEITLDLGADSTIDSSTYTDEFGAYAFTDLGPGTYRIREENQTGWVQTTSDPVDLDAISGTDISGIDFGNQGRGTVTVYKDVDTDGDGEVDVFGSTDWMWELETLDFTMGDTEDVAAGTYTLSEFQESGYHFVSLFCNDEEQEGSSIELTVEPGSETVCTYTNARDTGTLIVNKVVDIDGDTSTTEDQSPGWSWQFDVDGWEGDTSDPSAQFTSVLGSATFSDLKTGLYTAIETTQDGYDLIDAYCDNESGEFDGEDSLDELEVTNGETTTCTFINTPTGTLHGYKWNDANGDGLENEIGSLLSGWTINLFRDDGEGYTLIDSFLTDDGQEHFGWYWFEHLVPGNYKICEDPQTGWSQTYPLTSGGCHLVSLPDGNSGAFPELLNAVFGPTYNFGNVEDDPVLALTKSNNASTSLSPGGNVLYTLVLTLVGGNLSGVVLTDLPPAGFTYRSGSWTAFSSIRGDITSLGEPTYASPGTWTLGDMINGETITLTYIADISSSQDPGTYKDAAWASGFNSSSAIVLANTSSGYFVGTNVTVDTNPASTGEVNIEKGEVLGASTARLPATGANSTWIFLSLGLASLGLVLILVGRRLKSLVLSLALISLLFTFGARNPVLAVDDPSLSVQITEPKSPTRDNDWNLSFTALDIEGRSVTVKCYVKKPGSGSFVQFDSTKSLPAGGNSGSCKVDSGVMNSQGTYTFYVSADAGAGEETSNEVSVAYKTDGPGTPVNYSKERPWACRYIIKFKGADDSGKTKYVSVYRSKETKFIADGSTIVGSLTLTSNEEGQLISDLPGECDKNWYFVVRAFDDAGNGSGFAGDEVVLQSISSSDTESSAIPVSDTGGSILGQQDASLESGAEEQSLEEGAGLIMGDQDSTSGLSSTGKKWLVLIVGLALIALGIYARSHAKNR